MKDILRLLVLLNAHIITVCFQPYKADSGGNCRDNDREYVPDGSDLCCNRCRPGHRLSEECSQTNQTECLPCGSDLYTENWNYSGTCKKCTKCKSNKGLQYAHTCSSTKNAKCKCQPGMYCIMGFDDPYCTDCRKYKLCKAGYGVSKPGTAASDVTCEACPSGTFSDTASFTDRCQPHTNCNGSAVSRKGDATSDTECEQQATTTQPNAQIVLTTARAMMSTVAANSYSVALRGLTGSTQSVRPSASEEPFNPSTKNPPPTTEPGSELVAVVAGVIGFIFLFIIFMLLCLCKRVWRKDSARLQPKVDANGNCRSGDKINQNYLEESQLTSFTVTSPEQQYLLEKGEASSDHSQSSNTTEILTRTDGYNSHESIGPLQSTLGLDNPPSLLSEPMTLLSHTEPVAPQPSILTQSSSQLTNPHVISPVTTSPQVNVNITLNIGNGSCEMPSFVPTALMQADCKLPFGEEEESFSTPQQEDGKQSLMSIQESTSTLSTLST